LADCGWVQEAMMAAYTEVPGVYVEPDQMRITVIDHVEARFEGGKQLAVTNPTNYPASVKVRIRGQRDEVVQVPPHETRSVQFA
jgi:P pilus assembly chaperone PapD